MDKKGKGIKLGVQKPPEDYRIFKGTPSEFFQKAADEVEGHEEETKNGE